ncbi:SpoIID/LytB domain-containing protein [bacterium]|nr:SpoIID/LytB domain-containing protein [bacterium]
MIDINVGILWDEHKITGELQGSFAAQWRTEPDGWINLDHLTGSFSAVAVETSYQQHWAIRLAETLNIKAAEGILETIRNVTSQYEMEILEAGRVWQTQDGEYDNRVWWPIILLDSLDDAEPSLIELRKISAVNPLGYEIISLDKAAPATRFMMTIGERPAEEMFELVVRPLSEDACFMLNDVPIGRGFHWERKQALSYRGELRLFQPEGRLLTAVNKLPLESYLESTVGSEMRSDLPKAFAQAQAIAARSTVMATVGRHHFSDGFDLCNDDHCQCYQGILREAETVANPVRQTAGQVLTWQGRVADARYAKCCGGVSEYYESVWGPQGPDCFHVKTCGDFPLPDLTDEDEARAFLLGSPPSYCNPAKYPYPKPWDDDQQFRWYGQYTPAELGRIIYKKTGVDVGSVRNLRIRRRGKSGRVLILSVEGSVQTLKLFGELHIRRALAESTTPSSFFIVDYEGGKIKITGGGWGHGVGLCQLGAVAMANQGKSLHDILAFYYPGAELKGS